MTGSGGGAPGPAKMPSRAESGRKLRSDTRSAPSSNFSHSTPFKTSVDCPPTLSCTCRPSAAVVMVKLARAPA